MNILRIHFGYSNFNDGKWNEMNEKSQKKNHFGNRMRLSMTSKKLIVKQILLSQLWYIGQIHTITDYIKKEIMRKSSRERILKVYFEYT